MNVFTADLGKLVTDLVAPYVRPARFVATTLTILCSTIVFVSPVRQLVGFDRWSDGLLLVFVPIYFFAAIATFLFLLKSVGLTLRRFGNWFVLVDVVVLIVLLAVSLYCGSICDPHTASCEKILPFTTIFMLLQPPILLFFIAIKFEYMTGLDIFLALGKATKPQDTQNSLNTDSFKD